VQGACQEDTNPGGRKACTLYFKEDGIEILSGSQHVFLADLDLVLSAGLREHAGLLLVRGGDVWLKNVSFTGSGDRCRAIDMNGNARLFMSGAAFPIQCIPQSLHGRLRQLCIFVYPLLKTMLIHDTSFHLAQTLKMRDVLDLSQRGHYVG
jgi:hypothetical protein